MLKRLKRLWLGSRAMDANEESEELESAGGEVVATDPEPDAPTDPQSDRLAAFDELVRGVGARRAMPSLRELLVEAPSDARLLARSAELLRTLDDPELADLFDAAARSRRAAPFIAVSDELVAASDPELGLALAQAARSFEPDAPETALAVASALAACGRHGEVLAIAGDALGAVAEDGDLGAALAVRVGLSAIVVGDLGRFAEVAHIVEEAAPWLLAAAERIRTHGPIVHNDGFEERRNLYFTLYGTLLLDGGPDGLRVEPSRLARWCAMVAGLFAEPGSWEAPTLVSAEEIRPTWVGPRGEVLARWIASLLPDRPNPIPLSARIPGQRVLVVVADDAELARLWETRQFFDAHAIVFQATKDPRELGSPMADIVGMLGADLALPFEALEAERLAERLAPRTLAQDLQQGVGVVDQGAVETFLTWARGRPGQRLQDYDVLPDERPRLGVEAA